MNKVHLHIVSALTGSIGEITKDLCETFKKTFYLTRDWKNEIPKKREVLLCHFLNPQILENIEFNTFKFKVLIQPIDGTKIKKDVVKSLNKYDLIITPAEAGKQIMITNGVTTHIEVIPNFYKDDIFEIISSSPIKNEINVDNKIVFYHESSFHPRKGIEILYEGFIKAFSDTEYANKVVLLLKDLPYNTITFNRNERIKKQAIKLQKKYTTTPDILKLSCDIDFSELKYLWNKIHIYVSFAKIEGFGIPLLRMLLLKKPIITIQNNLSGYSDYLNDNNSYLVKSEIINAKDEFMWLYDSDSQWASVKIEDVIEVFKQCLQDVLDKKQKIQKDMLELSRFSYTTVTNKYHQVIVDSFEKHTKI